MRKRHPLAALLWAAAIAALALLLWLVLGPGEPGYDAHYSLVWGDQLLHLDSPDYSAPLSPTPHPLTTLIGAVASLLGGSDFLLALSYVSFAALGVAAFEVGRRSFGIPVGIGLAAILLTRPLLVGEALDASIDIPFLALVLGALALELKTPKRGAPVLVLLAVAGLLRPEAWLLSLAYVFWTRRRADALIAIVAPAAWLTFDLITTGDALHSLTRTQDLADTFGRRRGLGTALRDIPGNLEAILGSEIVWAGLAVCALAIFFAQQRARVPLAVLALGLAGFLVLGVADLPLLTRYLLVPAAMLALFCAAGIAAAGWLEPRPVGWVVCAGVLVALALSVADTRDGIDLRRDRIAQQRDIDLALLDILDRTDKSCRPIQVVTYRAVPLVAYRRGLDPSDVRVTKPAQARTGLVLTGPPTTLVNDVGLLPGVTIRSQDLAPPRSFRRVAGNNHWSAATACG
jgi:hypothetical protein